MPLVARPRPCPVSPRGTSACPSAPPPAPPCSAPRSCQPPVHALPSARLSSPNLARPGCLQPSQTLETSAQSPPPPGTGHRREHSHPWGWSHPWGHSYHWGQGVGDVILTDEAGGAGPGRVAPVSSRPERTSLQTNAGRSHTHTHTHTHTHARARSSGTGAPASWAPGALQGARLSCKRPPQQPPQGR